MRGYFERVFGAELDGTRSDKTDLLGHALQSMALLGHALQSMGVDPSQAMMIGDRSFDMVGARNNGMTAVGVLYGYGSEAELRDAGAHHVCATPRAVLDHIG